MEIKGDILCMCGSSDDREFIYQVSLLLIDRGATVLGPSFGLERPKARDKTNIMQNHFDRISMSDGIAVATKTKIGFSTSLEIGYALGKGKSIYIVHKCKFSEFVEFPDELTSSFPGINLVYIEDLIKGTV